MSDKEKQVFAIANNALYFDDNSDYGTALWQILKEIKPELFKDNAEPELHLLKVLHK